jgi:ribose/xylose/arabinose/galactoside ABC-type transport system permease subunit
MLKTRESIIAIIIIILMIVLTFATDTFLTFGNLTILARQISLVAIIAIGMTLVILIGGIDLSVGSVVALITVMTGMFLIKWNFPISLGILLALGMGASVGLLNGVIIAKAGVPPFVVTLGMMGVARGVALVITKGASIGGFPLAFMFLGQGYLLGIPYPVIIMVFIAIGTHIMLTRTNFGRQIYYVGSNEEAARLSGIRVDRIKISVFLICSLLASVEAVLETARMSTSLPAAGMGYELTAIGAVIIGGASLLGGEGTIIGTILGATLLGMITNGLIMLGVSAYWQQVFSGSIIIVAVTLDMWRKRK